MSTDPELEALCAQVMRRLEVLPPRAREASRHPACSALAQGQFCDGERHWTEDPAAYLDRGPYAGQRAAVIGRCFAEIRKAERKRLAGVIARSHRNPDEGFGFDGFDPKRTPQAAQALEAARAFAAGRPPSKGLVLLGGVGLGKTRLGLGAYFAHVEAGVYAYWIESLGDLAVQRRRRLRGYAEERLAGEDSFNRMRRASVLYFPDLGDPQAGFRRRGEETDVRDEIKDILDGSSAVVFVASNCTGKQLRDDPSVGEQLTSRLLDDYAVVVWMTGQDQRTAHLARRAPREP